MARQLDYKVGSMSAHIKSVAAQIKTTKDNSGQTWFLCDLASELVNGTAITASVQSRYAEICISDAASRLGRAMSREIKFSSPTRRATQRTAHPVPFQ